MIQEEVVKIMPGDLRSNQLVEIEVEGAFKGNYHSRVEEVGEDTLTLAMPIRKGEIVTLRKGSKITVNFMKNGANHAFQAEILDRARTPLPVLIVKMPVEAKKRQRRSWVRVPASLDFSFAPLSDKPGAELVFKEAQTLDISGGGLMFGSQQEFKLGDMIKLTLNLPSGRLELKAKVVRVIPMPDQPRRRYQIGLEFEEIKERQRDRVMRYIFDQQRKLIKKGLM